MRSNFKLLGGRVLPTVKCLGWPNQCFTGHLERRRETPTGGAAQGGGGAAEAGKGSERPRGQGDSPEGQTGEREGQPNRPAEVGGMGRDDDDVDDDDEEEVGIKGENGIFLPLSATQ